MFAVRSRALTCSSRALLARRTYATLSDAKGKTPLPNTHEGGGITDTTEPPNHSEESFGKGFYISIAAVVGGLAFYKLEQSTSGADGNPLTHAIGYYTDMTQKWEDRNSRHTLMVERAAADKTLYFDSKPSGTVHLKFPETLNAYSPYNNEVGWSGNYLAALQAFYEAERKARK